jgi:hypothetical protein
MNYRHIEPIPKFDYVRSPALLKACREIPCQHCGNNDGTVVAAHSNQAKHGKGRSIKASDQYVAALCYACHAEVDQSPWRTRAERERMWHDAWRKTVEALTTRGLWPSSIAVPE